MPDYLGLVWMQYSRPLNGWTLGWQAAALDFIVSFKIHCAGEQRQESPNRTAGRTLTDCAEPLRSAPRPTPDRPIASGNELLGALSLRRPRSDREQSPPCRGERSLGKRDITAPGHAYTSLRPHTSDTQKSDWSAASAVNGTYVPGSFRGSGFI